MSRSRRVPLFRIGLTLVIGSVMASLFHFYLSLGQSMAELNGETISTEPRELFAYFTRNVLFMGTVPGVLFYCGAAIMLMGIIRNFARPNAGAGKPPESPG